jgi:hypothetical protein
MKRAEQPAAEDEFAGEPADRFDPAGKS